jgi:hypothetical protein
MLCYVNPSIVLYCTVLVVASGFTFVIVFLNN